MEIVPQSTAKNKMVREGGCLCGAMRYRVTGPQKRGSACYCTFCQRRSGGALSVHAWFAEDQITITGTPTIYEHRSDESGQPLRLHFCRRCGTHIMLSVEKYPGVRL